MKYTIIHELRLHNGKKSYRSIAVDRELPHMGFGVEKVKILGKVYPVHFQHDAPRGFGLDDSPDFPESLVGVQIEIE